MIIITAMAATKYLPRKPTKSKSLPMTEIRRKRLTQYIKFVDLSYQKIEKYYFDEI